MLDAAAPPTENPDSETLAAEEEEKLYCADCGHLVTFGRWRISVQEGHEHVFFNPAGVIFRIGCFREAPGAHAVGQPSAEFPWFKGYRWQVAACRACRVHLGWLFTGAGSPPAFFGLILAKLTDKPRR